VATRSRWPTPALTSGFGFEHPGDDGSGDFESWARSFAQKAVERKFGSEHVADLDWESSEIYDLC
jgi:hypothetical protein